MTPFRRLQLLLVSALILSSSGLTFGRTTTCPNANPNDSSPDDYELNRCIAAGGTVTLEYGWPGYIIAQGLSLTTNYVRIEGDGGWRPVLIADPDLAAPMIRSQNNVTGYVITDVTFQGDKQNRTQSHICANDNTIGMNLQLRGIGFTITNIDSVGALCGSGMEIDGYDFTVSNNYVAANGISWTQDANVKWADGITIGYCSGGTVTGNLLVDNTDVDLIVGPGNCYVANNEIRHDYVYGFAGLMIGFGGSHSGTVVEYNQVSSGNNLLSIGLMNGHHPWTSLVGISDAGSFTNNSATGSVTLAWVEGISAGTFTGNTVGTQQGTRQVATWSCTATPAYAAEHFGSATIQGGYTSLVFDDGVC